MLASAIELSELLGIQLSDHSPDKVMVTTSDEVGFAGETSTLLSHQGRLATAEPEVSRTTQLVRIVFFVFLFSAKVLVFFGQGPVGRQHQSSAKRASTL